MKACDNCYTSKANRRCEPSSEDPSKCQRCYELGPGTECTNNMARKRRGPYAPQEEYDQQLQVHSLPGSTRDSHFSMSPHQQLDKILEHTNHSSGPLDPDQAGTGFQAAWDNSDEFTRRPGAPWH
ncbi:uncharacterized protein L199_003225 [Kwoniella botswanensis]|uniref:uncharacterized protein n=1 Tax=Kwoniella botswanensis TaxID=1268659 RepID=UPI00315D0D30